MLRDWLRSGRLQYATLWALAALFVGFAIAGRPLLGFDPTTLALLAAVFAASTAVYGRGSGCATSS